MPQVDDSLTVERAPEDTQVEASQLIDVTSVDVAQYTTDVADRIERSKRRSAKREAADEIAEEHAEVSSRRSSISVGLDTTDELRDLQEEFDIAEERIRALQAEADLARLHPSRRQEFIEQILEKRVESKLDEDAIAAEAEVEAERHVEDVFGQDGATVELTWEQTDSGEYRDRYNQDSDDVVVTIENAATDFRGMPSPITPDLVVLEDGSNLRVSTPYGEAMRTLDAGLYNVSPYGLRDISKNLGLIEVERQKASCTSSDDEALDIVVGRGEDENRAHVIELQTGDGGYNNRYTKGWTEYRDIDLRKKVVLILVGQASYYNRRIRGKNERAWLVGRDDGQVWAQQVYTTHETVAEALDFIVPSEVQRYEEQGREVLRQGDFYFVEMEQSSNFNALEGSRHEVDEAGDTTIVTHPEHEDLELDGEWKAVANNDGSQSSSSRSRTVARD